MCFFIRPIFSIDLDGRGGVQLRPPELFVESLIPSLFLPKREIDSGWKKSVAELEGSVRVCKHAVIPFKTGSMHFSVGGK
jgi:hypothetical protein